jgi:hypothetical protein
MAKKVRDASPMNEDNKELLDNAYRAAAIRVHYDEGTLEVDDEAPVSRDGEDDIGAYVQAWVWIGNDEAGIRVCEECKRVDVNPSDSGDWGWDSEDRELCPGCADKANDEEEGDDEPTGVRQLLVDSEQHAAILAALRAAGAKDLADHLDNHWSDYDPVCDCDDRSWYGEEHDEACPMEGKR